MTLGTVIGLNTDYDYTNLFTVGDLASYINDRRSVFTFNQYCDFRYSTDLQRFNFDPYTGEEIDWKWVKVQLNLLVTNCNG